MISCINHQRAIKTENSNIRNITQSINRFLHFQLVFILENLPIKFGRVSQLRVGSYHIFLTIRFYVKRHENVSVIMTWGSYEAQNLKNIIQYIPTPMGMESPEWSSQASNSCSLHNLSSINCIIFLFLIISHK